MELLSTWLALYSIQNGSEALTQPVSNNSQFQYGSGFLGEFSAQSHIPYSF